MGKVLSYFSLSSRAQSSRRSPPSTDSCDSEPLPPSCSDSASLKPRSRSLEHGSSDNNSVVRNRATSNPKLKCLIVPSFGKNPPDGVAPKKISNAFLPGVGSDLKAIQEWISKDNRKELVRVELMCHFEQVKVAEFKRRIKAIMDNINLGADNHEIGLLIWYTGHGESGTGNWVFQDGCLKFSDVYDLYMRCFKGRYLYIVTDCCYSGSWVVECGKLLDRDDIKCGHDAERQRVFIKVFASCLPNEKACDKFYTKCKGVKLQSIADRTSRTIAFAEHRELMYKSEDCYQTTLGVDFTQTDWCILGDGGRCAHHLTWTKLVQRLREEACSKNYLI